MKRFLKRFLSSPSQAGPWVAVLVAALLFLPILLLEQPLLAQFGRGSRVKDFKFPDFFEPVPGQPRTNRLRTLITGAEAEPHLSGIVYVKEMRIERYQEDGRTNLIATAPTCVVDANQRVVSSTGRLEVVTANGQLFLEGNRGFYCQLTNFNLIVSNQVRTVIRQDLLKSVSP